MQDVVAHFVDGSTLKGSVPSFRPREATFRMRPADASQMVEVPVADLKALFFVKDLASDGTNRSRRDMERVGLGRKVQVKFQDGEVMIGYTNGYSPQREGFWVIPADPESNNDRVFVMTAAAEDVSFPQ